MIVKNIDTSGLKFYSQKAIGIATFIGGPLASGYLIYKNYESLNDPDKGKSAFIIGLVSTIFLFVGIFSIPENIIDKVPNQVLPAIYTGIVYLIVENIHGEILKQHELDGKEFYSKWRAAGIGFISLFLIILGLVGYAFFSTDNEVYEEYEIELAQFTANEIETIKVYDEINSKPRISLLQELDYVVIPKWEENIEIVKKTNSIKNLPKELEERNKLLIEYAELRIEAFKIVRKVIDEGINLDEELEYVHNKIDNVLVEINNTVY